MEKVLSKFEEVTSDPYSYVAELRERKNKKVIGCFPMHIPEELVHAADIIPVVIWRGNELITWNHSHMPPYATGRTFVSLGRCTCIVAYEQ